MALHEDAENAATISTVAFAAGIAFAGAGVALLVATSADSDTKAHRRSTRASAAMNIAPGLVELRVLY